MEGEWYRLSYRLAADNLRLGTSVVADSCNPIEFTRNEWENVALESGARYVNIEVVCLTNLNIATESKTVLRHALVCSI